MKLSEYFEKSGKKQSAFSRETGIDPAMICRYANGGRKPTPVDALIIRTHSNKLVTEFDAIIKNFLDDIDLLVKKGWE